MWLMRSSEGRVVREMQGKSGLGRPIRRASDDRAVQRAQRAPVQLGGKGEVGEDYRILAVFVA